MDIVDAFHPIQGSKEAKRARRFLGSSLLISDDMGSPDLLPLTRLSLGVVGQRVSGRGGLAGHLRGSLPIIPTSRIRFKSWIMELPRQPFPYLGVKGISRFSGRADAAPATRPATDVEGWDEITFCPLHSVGRCDYHRVVLFPI